MGEKSSGDQRDRGDPGSSPADLRPTVAPPPNRGVTQVGARPSPPDRGGWDGPVVRVERDAGSSPADLRPTVAPPPNRGETQVGARPSPPDRGVWDGLVERVERDVDALVGSDKRERFLIGVKETFADGSGKSLANKDISIITANTSPTQIEAVPRVEAIHSGLPADKAFVSDPLLPASIEGNIQNTTSTPSNQSWAAMVKANNPRYDESSKLHYIAPQLFDQMPMAFFSNELLVKGAKIWENTIVLHVVGIRPSFYRLTNFAHKVWQPKGSIEVHSRENGFFLVQFSLAEDCDRVIEGGPWMFDRRLIILKRWSPEIKFEREVLNSVPTWIRIPGLPIQLWNNEGISRISSLIGKPLFMDEATSKRKRLAFARVFVELSSNEPIKKEVFIRLESGSVIKLPIEFEWTPPLCDNCKSFGHFFKQCSTQKEWIPVDCGTSKGLSDPASNTNSVAASKLDSSSGIPSNLPSSSFSNSGPCSNIPLCPHPATINVGGSPIQQYAGCSSSVFPSTAPSSEMEGVEGVIGEEGVSADEEEGEEDEEDDCLAGWQWRRSIIVEIEKVGEDGHDDYLRWLIEKASKDGWFSEEEQEPSKPPEEGKFVPQVVEEEDPSEDSLLLNTEKETESQAEEEDPTEDDYLQQMQRSWRKGKGQNSKYVDYAFFPSGRGSGGRRGSRGGRGERGGRPGRNGRNGK